MSPGEAAYFGFHLFADDFPGAIPPYASLPLAERVRYTGAAFAVIGWWTERDNGPDPAPPQTGADPAPAQEGNQP